MGEQKVCKGFFRPGIYEGASFNFTYGRKVLFLHRPQLEHHNGLYIFSGAEIPIRSNTIAITVFVESNSSKRACDRSLDLALMI